MLPHGPRRRPSAALVVAGIALLVSLSGWGYAATGGSIVLGGSNATNKPTRLSSSAAHGPTLALKNTGGQAAATFSVKPGVAPFSVGSAGKVAKLTFAFVSLDQGRAAILEPHFRIARQSGAVQAREVDEGMFLLGLQAAAWRVPFLPTRVGLGSDLFRVDPELRTVRSPYPGPDGGEGEELVAMPALELDAALVHVDRADARGNGQILGPDPYFDDLMCGAAKRRYVSCEKIVATASVTCCW